MSRWLVLAAGLMSSPSILAQRPPAVIPTRPDIVLEQLPSGYAALAPRKVQATETERLAKVEQLLATAASTGDSRLATRAEALLSGFPAGDTNPTVVRARAYAAQHRHDFDAAVRMLNNLIRAYPRDADARLSRAQMLVVQGHLDRARRDCAALAIGIDSGHGLLCTAVLSARIGDDATAARLLDRWLAQTAPGDELRRYALVMRAEAASRTGSEDTATWFRRALVVAPEDVRTLAAYARHLRHAGEHARVLELLGNAPGVDGLHLEKTLAAHAIGSPAAPAMIAAQARRYRLARVLGSEPELRDEAEFALTLQDDPERALALALRNFNSQRDVEDVGALRRAAAAAGRPEALQPMQAWMESQQLEMLPLGGEG